jgi:hypothetical protein
MNSKRSVGTGTGFGCVANLEQWDPERVRVYVTARAANWPALVSRPFVFLTEKGFEDLRMYRKVDPGQLAEHIEQRLSSE